MRGVPWDDADFLFFRPPITSQVVRSNNLSSGQIIAEEGHGSGVIIIGHDRAIAENGSRVSIGKEVINAGKLRVLGQCHSVQFCLQKCTGPKVM